MKKKIIMVLSLGVLIVLILGIMYLIDMKRMNENKPVVFSTWGYIYVPFVNTYNQNSPSNVIKNNYFKTIDNVELELNIPSEWKYKELSKNEDNDFYKYALKLYKNTEEQYAVLYFYYNQFGVCGTGRIEKNITLNNGNEANIGYYDGNKIWSDISFYSMNKNIAIINYGLNNIESDEVVEFIKTININENNL